MVADGARGEGECNMNWTWILPVVVGLILVFLPDPKEQKEEGPCDWCKADWEVCGTCKGFFERDEAKRCAADPGEYGCAYYEPFGYCPKCGRKLGGGGQ